MKLGNTTFIPENIAPSDAQKLAIFDSNNTLIYECNLGHLKAQNLGTKKYSVGLLSDTHICSTSCNANTDLTRAITWFSSNVNFTCICGDLAHVGSTSYISKYKEITDASKGSMPIYAIAGNHEFYSEDDTYYAMTDTIIKQYTGFPLQYTISNQPTNETTKNYCNTLVGNDVFIMCGAMNCGPLFNDASIQWLYETLEANRNKRCFLFFHPYLEGSQFCGDCTDVLTWDGVGVYRTSFIGLLKHYKNLIYFHGHSHASVENQAYTQTLTPPLPANYDFTNGTHSVHIPSLATPRHIDTGVRVDVPSLSEGYVMDVYENCVVLKGRDFEKSSYIPIATYCLDTTLKNVEANTFVDTGGKITV